MNFLSLAFVAFVAVSLLIYWHIPRKWRVGFLIFASAAYYGLYSPAFLLHFVTVIALNYLVAVRLHAQPGRALIGVAVALNIAHLAFFKYFNSLFGLLAPQGTLLPDWFKIVMPLAISFYTFQFIAFLVDVYRSATGDAGGKTPAPIAVEPGRFLLFMLFFPHLISGPILRAADFYRQVGSETASRDMQNRGLFLIALGLTKKLFIGDVLGYLINPVFKNPADYGSADALAAMLGYTAQLYCDFSGFIDIARGVAKLFGYDLPQNFNSPYFSTSFSEFWNRWHMTLSKFIRDCIYIPLGGNRVSQARQYFNLMTAMILSGIWHGETLNFLLWGALHGAYLAAEKLLSLSKTPASKPAWLVRNIWVILGWSFSLVFFRAPDFASALTLIGKLFVAKQATLTLSLVFTLIALTWFVQYLELRRDTVLAFSLPRAAFVLPVLLVVIYFLISRVQIPNEAFIYVQF
ncbi:MAG: MBOAT family protein [Leptospiraceae bacterium]|nr:MBOAT family protein [Leptospiraceae bacterium]